MRRNYVAPLAIILACGMLSACNTEEELLKQKLKVLEAEEKALVGIQQTLKDIQGLEGPGGVSIFLSEDLLNSVLAGADNIVIPVPGVDGATVQVRSMRADFKVGLPLVNVEAVAAKKGLDASLDLVGVALIETQVIEGAPQQLQLRVHLDSLVPRAKWGFFDFKLGGFARDLMQVKITDELRKVGEITIPIETKIPLSIPAKETSIAFTGVKGVVATPALSITGKATITTVLPLPDGLHVYGKITAKGGAI